MKEIWIFFLIALCNWKHLMAQRQQPTWERGFSDQYVSQNTLGQAAFGYNEDHTTGGSFRRETTDRFGNKMGSYGLRVGDGRVRIVNYVADRNGFRADVTSNEPGVASQKSNGYLSVTKKSIYGVLVPGFRYNSHPPHLVFGEAEQVYEDHHLPATFREEEIFPAAAQNVMDKEDKVEDDGTGFEQNFPEDDGLSENQKPSSVEKRISDNSQNVYINANNMPQDSATGSGGETTSGEFISSEEKGQSSEIKDENVTSTSSAMLSRRLSTDYHTESDTGSKRVDVTLNDRKAFGAEDLETQIFEKSEISHALESQTETSNTTVTSKEIS
ncbi:Cuticle protein 14 isoform b, partial [Stegodyphus mimosarum]